MVLLGAADYQSPDLSCPGLNMIPVRGTNFLPPLICRASGVLVGIIVGLHCEQRWMSDRFSITEWNYGVWEACHKWGEIPWMARSYLRSCLATSFYEVMHALDNLPIPCFLRTLSFCTFISFDWKPKYHPCGELIRSLLVDR